MILSNVGICGLSVRGILTFDDRAGDVGVVIGVRFVVRVALGEVKGWFAARDDFGGLEDGFALLEESVKRTPVICFLEGLFRLFDLI